MIPPNRHSRPHRLTPEPELRRQLRSLISEGHPLPLLIEASGIIEAATQRPSTASTPDQDFDLERLVESMSQIRLRETSAILLALRALLPPGPLADSITAELEQRSGHPLPGWIQQIDQIEVVSTSTTVDPLEDGDNIYTMVRWPTGHVATVWAYVDYNMGTIAKDALAAPWDIIEIGEKLAISGEELILDFIDPADARATIENAIAANEARFRPIQTDMWPRLRPLLEWVIAHLPAGGRGHEKPYWSFEERSDLLTRFVESSFGQPDPVDLAWLNAVRLLITFGCDYGTGNPTHWSPVSVELALDDFFATSITAPREFREMIPVALRDFIRFCHHEQDIPAELTDETIAAVARWEHATITGPTEPPIRDQLLDRLGIDDTYVARTLASLAEEVGGVDQLYELDARPLPDEAFDWSVVPDNIRDKMAEVLEHTDRCADELFDVEFRTILRRILARTADEDPSVFTRRRSDIVARTVVWMAGNASDMFSKGTLTVKDLNAWFGLSGNPNAEQAAAFRSALGVEDAYLGTGLEPSLTHSSYRAWIIELRDQYTQQLRQ